MVLEIKHEKENKVVRCYSFERSFSIKALLTSNRREIKAEFGEGCYGTYP